MDILGKGSVIGPNAILMDEIWHYEAVNKTISSAKILIVSFDVIKSLMFQDPLLRKHIKDIRKKFKYYGAS